MSFLVRATAILLVLVSVQGFAEGDAAAGQAKSAVCAACHGPAGEGNPLAGYPALAGQHAVYSGNQLNRFRGGENWGDEDAPSQVMIGVAARLTDEEIEAVASYIQGLYRRSE